MYFCQNVTNIDSKGLFLLLDFDELLTKLLEKLVIRKTS